MNKLVTKRRFLIVGEGQETEYNYFVGFRNAHEELLNVLSTSVSVRRGNGGDAVRIVRNAIKEVKKFEPDRKRGDRVFLLLDAEGPGNAPGKGRTPELPAAEKLATENGIEIVYCCPSFEYWLLCHFHKISRGQFADCAAVIAALNKRWSDVSNDEYDKADLDVYKRLANRVDSARKQALEVDLHHIKTAGEARLANPSTQVYELIARLIGVNTGTKWPLTGTWTLFTNAEVSVQANKGDKMPARAGEPRWLSAQ